MADTLGGGYPSPGSLRKQNRKDAAAVKMLQEAMTRRVGSAPSVTSSIGVTECVGQQFYMGGGELRFNSWAFTADPYGGPTGNAPTVTEAPDGLAATRAVVFAADGWYSIRFRLHLIWATSADPQWVTFDPDMSWLVDVPDPFLSMPTFVNQFNQRQVALDFTVNPMWCPAGGDMQTTVRWAGAGAPSGGSPLHLYVARVG